MTRKGRQKSQMRGEVLTPRQTDQPRPWSKVVAAFGQTAFGQNRIWPNKSEFGQVVFVTAFGQTAFGQFSCFSVLARFSGVVVVVPCWFLVGSLLVPVGACWCLLVLLLCVWWVCSRFLGLSPRTSLCRTAQNFALFFLSPAENFILSSLSEGSSRGILVVFLKAGALKCARLGSRAVV